MTTLQVPPPEQEPQKSTVELLAIIERMAKPYECQMGRMRGLAVEWKILNGQAVPELRIELK